MSSESEPTTESVGLALAFTTLALMLCTIIALVLAAWVVALVLGGTGAVTLFLTEIAFKVYTDD